MTITVRAAATTTLHIKDLLAVTHIIIIAQSQQAQLDSNTVPVDKIPHYFTTIEYRKFYSHFRIKLLDYLFI